MTPLGVLPDGYVTFAAGKITAVGPMERMEPPDEVIDVAGGHILPGLVDAHCHVGLVGADGSASDDGNEYAEPYTPHLRALDGIDLREQAFADARAAGVTALVTGPGSTNPIAGQCAAIKTCGRWVDEAVIKAPAAMKFALGENPKKQGRSRNASPVTRMGTAAAIRTALARAADYQARGTGFDPLLAALLPALGGLPAHFHAHRADDIVTALRISREFGLKPVIIHGTESDLLLPLLTQMDIPVVTGPILTDRSKPELRRLDPALPTRLHRAGVRFAICTDHPETPIQHLALCAGLAVRAGLDEETALAAITIRAAEIAGIDCRVGSIASGKDADLLVTNGHPLDWRGSVQRVFIDGKPVV